MYFASSPHRRKAVPFSAILSRSHAKPWRKSSYPHGSNTAKSLNWFGVLIFTLHSVPICFCLTRGLKYVCVKVLDTSEIAAQLRSRRTVILFGAGVSRPDPTCLPLAHDLVVWFAKGLIGRVRCSVPPAKLLDNLGSQRPETLYQVAADHFPEVFTAFLKSFDRGEPNLCHHVLASMLKIGVTPYLVTPNFDLEIEAASRGIEVAVTHPQIHEAIRSLDGHTGLLVKIHGDVSAPETIVATIRELARASQGPGPEFLREVTKRFDLWVVGYSGSDFDIMQALQTSPRRIMWNVVSEDVPRQVADLGREMGERLVLTRGLGEDVLRTIASEFSIAIPRFKRVDSRALLCRDARRIRTALQKDRSAAATKHDRGAFLCNRELD